MRRIVYVFLAAVVVAVAALGALPLILTGEHVRQQIADNVSALTGREMTFREAPRITFRPFLGIELDDVVLGDAGASASNPPLVRMERMQGQLKILPALAGRAEISRYRFVRPQFSLRVAGDGKLNWEFPQGLLRSVLNEARARREATPAGAKPDLSAIAAVSLGKVEIVDGTLAYENSQSGHTETFTNVNAQVSWPATSSTWSMSGSGVWRNESFAFSAGSSQPLLLLSGGTAPANLTLSSGALEFSFEGEANLIADLHLAGSGNLATPSLRRFAGLFGRALPPGSTLSAFSMTGTLDATPAKLAFTEADIVLDGNAGRGALQLSMDKSMRPKLSGTIAAGQVDLSPYVADLVTDESGPSGQLPDLPMLDMEMDLRLSAASAKAGELLLTDLAATISLHNGDGVIELGNASMLGGTVTGEANLRKDGGIYLAKVNAIASGIDAGAAARLAGAGHFSVTGTASTEGSLTARGKTLAEMRQAVTGQLTARVENGVLYGVDFADLLRLAQSGTRETPKISGETAFRTLDANLRFNPGFAEISHIAIANSKVTAQLAGRTELTRGGLALRMLVTPTMPSPEGTPAPEARAVVGGSLANPVLTSAPALGIPDIPAGDALRPEPDPVSLQPQGASAN